MAQMSTGLSRQERRTAAAAVGKPALLILNLNEAAAVAGLARRTLERLIYKGEGLAHDSPSSFATMLKWRRSEAVLRPSVGGLPRPVLFGGRRVTAGDPL